MSKRIVLLVIVMLLLTTGCASLFQSGSQRRAAQEQAAQASPTPAASNAETPAQPQQPAVGQPGMCVFGFGDCPPTIDELKVDQGKLVYKISRAKTVTVNGNPNDSAGEKWQIQQGAYPVYGPGGEITLVATDQYGRKDEKKLTVTAQQVGQAPAPSATPAGDQVAKADLDKANADKAAAEARTKTLEADLKTAQTAMSPDAAKVKEEVDKAKAAQKAAEDKVASLQTQLTTAQDAQKVLQTRITELEKQVAAKNAPAPVRNVPAGTTTSVRPQPVGWCAVGNDATNQQSVNWDGDTRVWMSDRLVVDLRIFGGTCDLHLGAKPVSFVLNSIAGDIRLDGRTIANDNRIKETGSRLVITYAPNVLSNGYDAWIGGISAPESDALADKLALSMQTAGTSVPFGNCTVAGKQYGLLTDGKLRTWIPFEVNEALKVSGGHCELDLRQTTRFTLNSVEGRLSLDGTAVGTGNGRLLTGTKLVAEYDEKNPSNGFDIWFLGVTGVGAPPAQPQGKAQAAYGSCTFGGSQHDMLWDPGKGILYMDPWLPQARASGETVNCHVRAVSDGILKIFGRDVPMKAGDQQFPSFPPGDPSMGAAFVG